MATSGFVQAVDQEAQELVLNFDGHLVNYDFGELDEIVPAYAITIHKSQGSEYPAVVIPLSMQHYLMLRRNLIYTHRHHAGKTPGGAGRAAQSIGDCGPEFAGPTQMVESEPMARW
jgi:hypothetical protein